MVSDWWRKDPEYYVSDKRVCGVGVAQRSQSRAGLNIPLGRNVTEWRSSPTGYLETAKVAQIRAPYEPRALVSDVY